MKSTTLFKDFFKSEKAAGLTLIFYTIVSLIIANSQFADSYHHFWEIPMAGESIGHWINDGLMTIFFLLIGLELNREIRMGELSNFKEALFPAFGAIGGMLLPAGIYLLFNYGTPTQSGAGIPMATDIAFSLGVLSLLGKKVPTSLKVFLTALAVIDDLGAILVIAIFYSHSLALTNLFIALLIFALLLLLNKLGVKKLTPYLAGGVFMWFFMLHSGIHATIAGVLLAFTIPISKNRDESPSHHLERFLNFPVAFIILPIFAMANTAITFKGDLLHVFTESYGYGVALGLIVGKPLGIFLMTFLAAKIGIAKIPSDLKWKEIFSVGILGGIGFTMSIFITLLAYESSVIVDNTKLVILISSLVAGTIGLLVLKLILKKDCCED